MTLRRLESPESAENSGTYDISIRSDPKEIDYLVTVRYELSKAFKP
jgi:hypothetical protein